VLCVSTLLSQCAHHCYYCSVLQYIAYRCEVVTIQINSESKVTAQELQLFLDAESQGSDSTAVKPLKGIILSSPSNPTGAMLTDRELQDMAQLCDERGTSICIHSLMLLHSTALVVIMLKLVQSNVCKRLTVGMCSASLVVLELFVVLPLLCANEVSVPRNRRYMLFKLCITYRVMLLLLSSVMFML
jgi:Aminotransferase class I and II